MASRSAVQVPKRATGFACRSAGTQTQWASAPTSIPAASGFFTSRRARRRRFGSGKLSLRGVIAASITRGKEGVHGAAGAGATSVKAVSQAGSRRSVSPVLWSPARVQPSGCVRTAGTLVHEDIVLEQAAAIPVKIQNAEGRPLAGAWVTGISAV